MPVWRGEQLPRCWQTNISKQEKNFDFGLCVCLLLRSLRVVPSKLATYSQSFGAIVDECLLKPGMLECLLRSDPVLRIIDEYPS